MVDGELAVLREDMLQIRKEMQQTIQHARQEASSAAQSVADSQRAAQALVEVGVTQLKENVARIENEVREARAQHLDLAQQHAAASAMAAERTDGARVEARQGLAALEVRVGANEASIGRVRAELDEGLRPEHKEVVAWSVSAREQLARLRTDTDTTSEHVAEALERLGGLDTVSSAHAEAARLAAAEGGRHRDAIELLVSNLDQASTAARARGDELAQRMVTAEGALESHVVSQRARSLADDAEHARTRESLEALEAKCTKLHEVSSAAKPALSRHAERIKALEGDATALRKDGSEHSASLRQLKAVIKEVGDGLSAHKRDTRRVHEGLDNRCEAYDAAIGTLAEHCKIPNPVAAALGEAAAAL